MSPAKLLAAASIQAQMRNPSLMADWVTASVAIGAKLPESALMWSVQRLGKLDILLRAMEDDFKPGEKPASDLVLLMEGDWQLIFSELWIGAA